MPMSIYGMLNKHLTNNKAIWPFTELLGEIEE